MNLDESGRAYRYLGEKRGYERIGLEEAIAHAFDSAEELIHGRDALSSPRRGDSPVWDRE